MIQLKHERDSLESLPDVINESVKDKTLKYRKELKYGLLGLLGVFSVMSGLIWFASSKFDY